eukprot:TRINITY_DN2657_c0_g1_i1.p1 TRINITY_DN2657_c0_g1~~TRINITY_DN2657_c0_g1_i1.p1  ORF type:complete len:312 (-),score=60.30 TRINITY_DN2657_c0_g1_i1:584-1519(-)
MSRPCTSAPRAGRIPPIQQRSIRTAPAASHAHERSLAPSALVLGSQVQAREDRAKAFLASAAKRKAKATAEHKASDPPETARSSVTSTARSGMSTARSMLATARSGMSTKRCEVDTSALVLAEERFRVKLFRHKRQSILDAFGAVIQDKGSMGTKAEYKQVLGSLLIYPGDSEFDQIWDKHDNRQCGRVDYNNFVKRFVMSVSGGLDGGTLVLPSVMQQDQQHEQVHIRLDLSNQLRNQIQSRKRQLQHAFRNVDKQRMGRVARCLFYGVLEKYSVELSAAAASSIENHLSTPDGRIKWALFLKLSAPQAS